MRPSHLMVEGSRARPTVVSFVPTLQKLCLDEPLPASTGLCHTPKNNCRALALGALRRHTISPGGVGMGMGVAERIRHIRAAARDMEADPPPPPPAAAMALAQPGARTGAQRLDSTKIGHSMRAGVVIMPLQFGGVAIFGTSLLQKPSPLAT